MTDFKIETGIPIPSLKARGVYPFTEMKVGDSILATGYQAKGVRSAASAAGIRLGFKFTCRAEGDGIRVWRVA